MPVGDHPLNLPDVVADELHDAAQEIVKRYGVGIEHLVILLKLDTGEEIDSTTAGFGVEDPLDCLTTVITHAILAGKELGISIQPLPVKFTGEG